MKFLNKTKVGLLALIVVAASCQKKDKPTLGDYPKDTAVTPSSALRFYASFDSTSEADKQINVRFKDSISNYPSFFPDASLTYQAGVHGTALKGNADKYLSYYSANDFAKSTSFSVSLWEKHDGANATDAEFLMSFPSSQGHWSNAGMLYIIDNAGAGSTKDSAVIKLMVAEIGNGDHWFEFTGANRVAGILDNNWHHLVAAYDETTSALKLYKDGTLYGTQTWAGHGPIKLDYTKYSAFYLGGKTTDWGKQFNGGIDQFRLYNKALTAAEVTALYTSKL